MIEMRLKVELGVSEELRGLVREVLPVLTGNRAMRARHTKPGKAGQTVDATPEETEATAAPEAGATKEATAAPKEAQREASPIEDARAHQEEARTAKTKPEPQEAPASTEATPKTQAPAEVTPPTDQEMRDMMDITISRLAGNGWAESRDAGVVMIRKGCTKRFKEIARHLGAERPTALQGEARVKFLAHLEEIYVNKGTGDVEWMAF